MTAPNIVSIVALSITMIMLGASAWNIRNSDRYGEVARKLRAGEDVPSKLRSWYDRRGARSSFRKRVFP